MMEQEEIERALCSTSTGTENIPTLLSRLCRYLQEQEQYSRALRLLSVTSAVRAFYLRKHTVVGSSNDETETTLDASDAFAILREKCQKVKLRTHPKYVNRKGVEPQVFEGYFCVVEQYLASKLIRCDGVAEDASLFEQMQTLQPTLTRDEYARKHKAIIEYLLSLVEKETVDEMRKQFK